MSARSSPTVSVVIPCYNPGLLLYRSLYSVLRQSHPAHEIIVVDDCSTDDSRALVERYFPETIYLRNDRNRGVSATRNRGAAVAIGDYIAFLDADDAWMETKLQEQIGAMAAEKAQISFTGFKDLRLSLRYWGLRFLSGPFCDVILAGIPFNASTVIVARDTFAASGGFREDLRRAEDIDLFYRLALADVRGCYLPQPLAWYFHDNEANLTCGSDASISFAELAMSLHAATPDRAGTRLHKTLWTVSRHFATRCIAARAAGRTDSRRLKELTEFGTGPHVYVARVVAWIPGVPGRLVARAVLQGYRRKQQRVFREEAL